MRKRVYVYVTPFFPAPDSWRGAYCYDFVKELKRQISDGRAAAAADDVIVMTEGDGTDYEINGINVFTFKTWRLPSNVLPLLFMKRNQESFLNKLSSLEIRASDIEICHGHTANYCMYPLAVKKLNVKCRTFLHHHDLQSFGLNLGILRHCSLYNVWLFRKYRKLFEQIDTHIFISERCRESFLQAPDASWTVFEDYRKQMRGPKMFRCRPVSIKDSLILHNGIDTSIFHPSSSSRSSSSAFTIGCIANFIDLKDQSTLIRAAGVICSRGIVKQGVDVIFVGSGPMLEECKKLAKSVEEGCNTSQRVLSFGFRSEVPHEELAIFYHSIDLFVLPSYFEGFGCVLTEAWSCGVPFIACEGQGSDDLLGDDRGKWLYKPCAVTELADKVERYYLNRERQSLVCKVDVESMVTKFIKDIMTCV